MAPLEQTARPLRPSWSAIGCTVRGGRPLDSTTLKPASTAARTASLVRCDRLPSWRSSVPSRSLAINSIGTFVTLAFRSLCMEGRDEGIEAARLDRAPESLHQFLIVMQVVPGQQHRTQHFLGLDQVVEIAAGIVA